MMNIKLRFRRFFPIAPLNSEKNHFQWSWNEVREFFSFHRHVCFCFTMCRKILNTNSLAKVFLAYFLANESCQGWMGDWRVEMTSEQNVSHSSRFAFSFPESLSLYGLRMRTNVTLKVLIFHFAQRSLKDSRNDVKSLFKIEFCLIAPPVVFGPFRFIIWYIFPPTRN